MKKSRVFIFVTCLTMVAVAAEAQRRGFSSSGAGKGAYDGTASTSSWNIDSSLDGDCLAQFNKVCSELSPAQYQSVKAKYDAASAANYDSNADFETANALGYTLTADDGTTWSEAQAASTDLETDCNDTHNGNCDAITKTQFVQVNDGRADAVAAGYDGYADWSDANAQGYLQNATDQSVWAEAKANSLSAFCEAEVPGETECSALTKSQYQAAQNGNALMEAKIAKVTAGTLIASDLDDLGLDLTTNSTLGNNPAQWKVDYLETVLATASGTSKSDWQTTIDAFALSTSALWKIGQIQTGAAGHPTSDLSVALLSAAGVSSSYTSVSGIHTDLQGVITNASLTQSTDVDDATSLNSWIAGMANPSWSTTPSLSMTKAEDTVDASGDQIVLSPATSDLGTVSYAITGTDAASFSVSGGTITASGTIAPGDYAFTLTASTPYSTTDPARNFTLNVPDQVAQSSITIATKYVNPGATKTLSLSGGSGDGALTYTVTAGNCTVSGSTLTGASTVGNCTVKAVKASTLNYESAQTTKVIKVVTAISVKPNKKYTDGKCGSGWHTQEFSISGGQSPYEMVQAGWKVTQAQNVPTGSGLSGTISRAYSSGGLTTSQSSIKGSREFQRQTISGNKLKGRYRWTINYNGSSSNNWINMKVEDAVGQTKWFAWELDC